MFKVEDFVYSYDDSGKDFSLRVESFMIKRGEVVFLQGPSGCGKTTFLNILAGVIESPLKNTVRKYFNSVDYIMHQPKLLPWLNIEKNIKIGNKLKNQICDQNLFLSICRDFKLGSRCLSMVPGELSLGMRQRLEIALALSYKSGLILLDEGLSGIDRSTKTIVIKKIWDHVVNHKVSIVGTAHQLSDMLKFAQRVYFVDKGILSEYFLINEKVSDRIDKSINDLYRLESAEFLLNHSLLN